MRALIGTGVALVTPFQTEGAVDTEALTRIVNFQIENGIEYIPFTKILSGFISSMRFFI